MASRLMHLIIGHQIAERLHIEDRTSFLLGSIAPDAVQTKDESHFFKGDHRDFSRYIDYHGFLDKYRSYSDNFYVLGYFVHLIADDLWLKGFLIPWLRNRMQADSELYSRYHQDFRILNGKLLEHYGAADEMRKAIDNPPEVMDLQEVKSRDVAAFVPQVLEDMKYDKQDIDAQLQVFTFVQIIGYLETSVNLAIMKLQQVIPSTEAKQENSRLP